MEKGQVQITRKSEPNPPQGVVVWLLQTIAAVAVAILPLECQASPACSCHGDGVSEHSNTHVSIELNSEL